MPRKNQPIWQFEYRNPSFHLTFLDPEYEPIFCEEFLEKIAKKYEFELPKEAAGKKFRSSIELYAQNYLARKHNQTAQPRIKHLKAALMKIIESPKEGYELLKAEDSSIGGKIFTTSNNIINTALHKYRHGEETADYRLLIEKGIIKKHDEEYFLHTVDSDSEGLALLKVAAERCLNELEVDRGGKPDIRPLTTWVERMVKLWVGTLGKEFTFDILKTDDGKHDYISSREGITISIITEGGQFLRDMLVPIDKEALTKLNTAVKNMRYR